MGKRFRRLACFLLSLLICLSTASLLAEADTQPFSKTTTVTFGESLQQNQSQTINLPNLQSVDKVTVNNGNVGFAQNGTSLTINVSNGSVQRSYTPSTTATSTSDQYLNSSFPATKAYNDGTYSGSLSQSGSPYVISGSYSSASSKNVSVTSGTYDVHEYILCIGANDKTQWGYSVGGPPDTYYYNDGTYSGTLPMTQYLIYSSSYTDYYYCRLPMTIGQYYNSANRTVAAVYSGTVNYAGYDTRTWRQNYSGTVYAATQNYYSYTVTINYVASYSKPALTVTADNSNNRINLSWRMSDTTQAYNYTIYRKGPSDPSFQSVVSCLTGMSWTDTSGRDTVPPNAPTISGVSHNSDFSQYTVNYSSTDTGTAYQYYVEAVGQSDGTRIQSPTVSATITTGIKGYSIVVDDSSGTVPNGTITSTVSSYTFTTPASDDYYIHVNAVDNAGNISTVIHYHVDDMVSVTHPISVSYSIDPNSSTPFVAPDIPIKNNSTFPVKVSVAGLKSASGISDVSPSTYTNWNNLTASQTESGIALDVGVKETAPGALTWAEIDRTTPIYSTDITSTTLLGALNPNGATGNLTLAAKYGLAWMQSHTTVHNLVLDFEIDG